MECTTKFNDFISNISLPDALKQKMRAGYKELKANLMSHEIGKDIIAMFLQGSYARSTGVKPLNKTDKGDVDLVVVTTYDSNVITAKEALERFEPFLDEFYKDKWEPQRRSLGIKFDTYDIDLVPTAVPSTGVQALLREAFSDQSDYSEKMFDAASSLSRIRDAAKHSEDWRDEPLRLPDRETNKWDDTHPLAQIEWSVDKNERTGGLYKKTVKAIKWWKKNFIADCETIKSYPLEHFIGDCCPDEAVSLAHCVAKSLYNMSQLVSKPYLADRGVPHHNVFARVTDEDYSVFNTHVKKAYKMAEEALKNPELYDSSVLWRQLFGNEFPTYDKDTTQFTKREEPSTPTNNNRYA